MLETATQLMRDGASPSVSAVAEVSGVSRSTAYRYFATQEQLVQAVVAEALGPILSWDSDAADPTERMSALIRDSFPRITDHEATFRAALRLALEVSAPGDDDVEQEFGRGHRVQLLARALDRLGDDIEPATKTRLSQALSLFFGIESIIVLKDIWGLSNREAEEVALWASAALIDSVKTPAKKQPLDLIS
jgi:AcrR family transcriptional regulator